MTKVKTDELKGSALDWAVAKWLYPEDVFEVRYSGDDGAGSCVASVVCLSWGKYPVDYEPSLLWSQGGPLIQSVPVGLMEPDAMSPDWSAWVRNRRGMMEGPTPLIAACRAIVLAKLGDEVEIPEELTQ